jgi:hypothetical protein
MRPDHWMAGIAADASHVSLDGETYPVRTRLPLTTGTLVQVRISPEGLLSVPVRASSPLQAQTVLSWSGTVGPGHIGTGSAPEIVQQSQAQPTGRCWLKSVTVSWSAGSPGPIPNQGDFDFFAYSRIWVGTGASRTSQWAGRGGTWEALPPASGSGSVPGAWLWDTGPSAGWAQSASYPPQLWRTIALEQPRWDAATSSWKGGYELSASEWPMTVKTMAHRMTATLSARAEIWRLP